VDVINCAKFYRNRSRGFDSVRGRSLTIPIGLPICHIAVNTGGRPSTCDLIHRISSALWSV